METDSDSHNDAQQGDQNPLPVAHPAPKAVEIPAADPVIPAGKQNEASADPKHKHGYCHGTNAKHPFFITAIESREFSRFEKRTISFGWTGLTIGGLSLLAACIAGFLVYHQWWEMNSQTGYMNRAAIQARKDSADSSATTAKQLDILQKQLTQLSKQARAAQTNAQTAENALHMEERAWVASEIKVTGPLHFRADGVFLPIDFAMTNIGHSPAQDVTTWAQLIPGLAAPSREKIVSYCRVLKQTNGHPPNGIVLFPTGFHSNKQPVALNRKSVDEALKSSAISGEIGFSLITCVDYTMGFDPGTHHQTRESYSIAWTRPGGYLMGAFDPSVEYTEVSLIKQAGDSAD